MAVDKLVDSTQLDSDLTDVADEIRTAGGTLLPLSFPDDYVVAIGDIGNTEIKTASGSIAHFEDALARKAQDLTVAIEPVQDLHGYDNPWPAGGGKNLLENKGSSRSNGGITWTVNADGSISLSGTAGENYVHVYINTTSTYQQIGTGDISLTCSASASYNPNIEGINFQNDIYVDGVYSSTIQKDSPTRAYSGTQISVGVSRLRIAPSTSIPSGTKFYPAIEIGTAISSAWTPYSNICPISGWTGANVTRTGKNLLDTKNFAPAATTSSGITIAQNQDGSFKVSGTATGVVNLWLRGAWGGTNPVLKLYAGKTYFIKDVMLYRGTSQIGPTVYMGQTGTYTPSADIEVTGIRASTPNGTTLDTTIYPYVTDSADTEWQEFGTTYSITFPASAGTVYGGTLDVTTGKLTVDRAGVDLGTLTWENRYTGLTNKTILSHLPSMLPHRQQRIVLAENYQYFGIVGATTQLRDPDNLAVGLRTYYMADFGEYDNLIYAVLPIGDTPAGSVIYPLATPIVYDLTPTEVTTLLGTNNVWADTGDSTIKYIAPKAQIPSAQGVYF